MMKKGHDIPFSGIAFERRWIGKECSLLCVKGYDMTRVCMRKQVSSWWALPRSTQSYRNKKKTKIYARRDSRVSIWYSVNLFRCHWIANLVCVCMCMWVRLSVIQRRGLEQANTSTTLAISLTKGGRDRNKKKKVMHDIHSTFTYVWLDIHLHIKYTLLCIITGYWCHRPASKVYIRYYVIIFGALDSEFCLHEDTGEWIRCHFVARDFSICHPHDRYFTRQ